MTTVSQLINQISDMLHSYTATTEAATFLTEGIDTDDLVIPVAHANRLRQGYIEIGDEIMRVVDAGGGTVTLFPDGRGNLNTTAVAHPVNSRVTNDPLIPRIRIFDEVKATLLQVKEKLFVEKTVELTSSVVQTTYQVPADLRRVLRVQYESIGPSGDWVPVYRYDVDLHADTATGKSLTIHAPMDIGRRVQVTYAADVPIPTAVTDDLETLGILPEWHDVVRFGVAWRAVQMLAPARMNLRSIEANTDAPNVDPNSITNVAKQFLGMFQLRLDQEVERLHKRYPVRKHAVR